MRFYSAATGPLQLLCGAPDLLCANFHPNHKLCCVFKQFFRSQETGAFSLSASLCISLSFLPSSPSPVLQLAEEGSAWVKSHRILTGGCKMAGSRASAGWVIWSDERLNKSPLQSLESHQGLESGRCFYCGEVNRSEWFLPRASQVKADTLTHSYTYHLHRLTKQSELNIRTWAL